VELIRKAAFAVTNDSGPMHIAAALSVPVFAVFGPTDPALTGPYGAGFRKVIREPVSCSPCRKKSCRRHECIGRITEEAVLGEISAFLSSNPVQPRDHI
jgi:ADP-heptose:LPS heptosyltransferase